MCNNRPLPDGNAAIVIPNLASKLLLKFTLREILPLLHVITITSQHKSLMFTIMNRVNEVIKLHNFYLATLLTNNLRQYIMPPIQWAVTLNNILYCISNWTVIIQYLHIKPICKSVTINYKFGNISAFDIGNIFCIEQDIASSNRNV